ncbi:hypothetical protein AQUCO_00700029v1 [Aquilegia coerulea]|uniref:MADS-box domain-containing protein n=1 Tax=Aquilegia coerulea TaxID=218851 RepID=A0A2G5EI56_AQUCA|nr:hypothetical protein AQUCO_00700029v1 [Aquilegia coerulea]
MCQMHMIRVGNMSLVNGTPACVKILTSELLFFIFSILHNAEENSRRRKSVFKKASELSTLCGAQTGVVVFSPGDKPFSFGQPSVSAVVDRYLNGNNPPQDLSRFEAYRKARIQKFNEQGGVVQDQFESAVKRCDALTKIKEQNQKEFRLPSEEEGSSFEELQKELEKMDGMTTNMVNRNEFIRLFRSPLPSSMAPNLRGYVGLSVQDVTSRSNELIGSSSMFTASNRHEHVVPLTNKTSKLISSSMSSVAPDLHGLVGASGSKCGKSI